MLSKLAAVATVALVAAGNANAGYVTDAGGAVTIWNFTSHSGLGGADATALPTNPSVTNANKLYSGTYTGNINFTDISSSDNVGTFLSSAGGAFTSALTSSQASTTLSTGFTGNTGIVTIMEFVLTLTAETVLITHDDGVALFVHGNTTTDLLDPSAANPTSAATSTVTVGAGTYDLWYAEVNGLPAELVATVPEPASLALLGAGLIGAAALRRRSAK